MNVNTFEDVVQYFVPKMARVCERRYRLYGLPYEDFKQEMYVYLYDKGQAKVRRWLASSPQQNFRIYRSLLDQGLAYGEREKAERVGYHVDDVFWYTPNMISAIMPLVLDDTFTEDSGKIGELVVSVIDVRRVLTDDERDFFLEHNDAHPMWEDTVQRLIGRLGGDRPYVGRRRVMTNAHSQAITKEADHG